MLSYVVVVTVLIVISNLILLLAIGRSSGVNRGWLIQLLEISNKTFSQLTELEVTDIEFPQRDPLHLESQLHWMAVKIHQVGFTLPGDPTSDKLAYQLYEIYQIPIIKYGRLTTGQWMYYFEGSPAAEIAKRFPYDIIQPTKIELQRKFSIGTVNANTRAGISASRNVPVPPPVGDSRSRGAGFDTEGGV